MQQADVEPYNEPARMAEDMGGAELEVQLEAIATDEARHVRQTQRLVRGM